MPLQSPMVELYSIGTELVYGRIQDTNSFWMAQQITQLGARVRRITQLTDDLADLVAAFRGSMARGTRWVISSGGLGPTPDDLTNRVLSILSDSPLVPRDAVIADYVKRRNLAGPEEVSPNLIRMATIPACAKVMLNPVGWAPCTRIDLDGTSFIALPGPPREMEGVFNQHVLPLLKAEYQRATAVQRVHVNTYESNVSPLLHQIMAEFPGAYLKGFIAMRAEPGWLPIDLMALGGDEVDARRTLDQILGRFRELLAEKELTLRLPEERSSNPAG